MNRSSIEQLELAGILLGEMTDELVFIGGASIGIWITDPITASALRTTEDVDVVAEASGLYERRQVEKRLLNKGFSLDQKMAIRYQHRETGLVLDVLPSDVPEAGFSSAWFRPAFDSSVLRKLPSGLSLRFASPPYLLALKMDAFLDRGQRDAIASKDLEDIVALVGGRRELIDEVGAVESEVRNAIGRALEVLCARPNLIEEIQGQVPGDDASQERAKVVVVPRLRQLVELASVDQE